MRRAPTAVAATDALKPVLGKDAVASADGNAAYWTMAKYLEVEAGYFILAYHGKGGNGVWHVHSENCYVVSLDGGVVRFKGVATKCLGACRA